MKTKLLGFVLFFLSVFLFISAANAKETINTVQTMVSYEDLTQIMKNDVGKYFVLPISEYEKLKAEKEKNIELISSHTPGLIPPIPHLIRTIKVFGRISEKFAFVEAEFNIEKLTEGYADFTLFSGKAAIEKAFLNNKPISITSSWKNTDFIYIKDNIRKQTPRHGQTTGYWDKYITTSQIIPEYNNDNSWAESEFKVPLTEKGMNECKVSFIVPIENNEGLYSLLLNLSKSTSSFVKFEVPNTVIAVDYTTLSDYSVVETKANNGCEFIGWAGADNSINIKWRHKFLQQQTKIEPKNTQEPVDPKEDQPEPIETPIPPKPQIIIKPLVYAHSQTIFSVGQTLVYGQKTIEYSISKAPISKLLFEIPADVEITDVQASGQYAQKIVREGNKKKLQIELMTEQRDRYSIDIFYEQNIKIDSNSLVLPEIIPLGIERELGNTAIESLSSSEIQLSNEEGYKLNESVYLIDPIELPAKLKEKAARPIILAFNHSICPTDIKLSIKRYKEVEQKTVVADSMLVKTTFTTNSTSNTQIDLAIRNNNKQYLQLQLASGAEIISTLRDGKSVKTVNGKIPGTVQIPLEMSRSIKDPVNTKLQIMIKEPINQMKWKGKLKFAAPAIDIPVAKFDWDVFAPENYQLFNFKGTVENSARFETPFLIEGFIEIATLAYEMAKTPVMLAVALFLVILILGIFFEKSFSKFLTKLFSPVTGLFKTLFFKGLGRAILSIILMSLIIALIYAFSIPNFRKARMQSPEKACMANMRIILSALEMYEMDNSQTPSYIDINTLVNQSYLKYTPQCSQGGTYYINYPDQVFCSAHGSLGQTQPRAEAKKDMAMSKAKVAKPSAVYPQKEYSRSSYSDRDAGFFADEEAFEMVPQEIAAPSLNSIAGGAPARQKLEEKAREMEPQGFGTTKKTGLLPIKTNLVKTKNYQNFRRDLIIPEGEQNNFTQTNPTYPEVTFYYVLEHVVKAVNVIAFLLAMLAGLYFVSGSAKNNKFKIGVAAIILLILSVIDIKINTIGVAANSGFWLAIFLSFVWKTFMLIKTRLAELKIEEENKEKERITEKVIEEPTKPDSGKINLVLMMFIVLMMLITPAIISANTQIASETTKEIRIMAPFKDISTILPADGKVVFLSEEDYRYLKDIKTIEAPKVPENPHEYVFNSVSYIGTAENNGVRFKGIFKLELFNDKWKKIPLLSKNAVTSNVIVDKKPQSLALINIGNDEYYALVTNESGLKTIEIDFFVKSQENRPVDNTFFTLETVTSSISILELTINKENCDAVINPGIIKSNENQNGKTVITAAIPPTSAFSFEVFNKITETSVPTPSNGSDDDPEEYYDEDEEEYDEEEVVQIVEEPTRVSVKTSTLLNFKENFVSGIIDTELNIRGTKGINSFRFAIPESIHITNVINTAILENWEEITEDEQHFLELTFKSVIKGAYKLEITFENELKGQKEKEYEVPELIPQNVEQSQGMLGIGCIEDLEINAKGTPEGYTPIASGEFFREWTKARTEKLPYAFRYFKHPNKLSLTVTRPENIEMLSAVIDKAEAITLINTEGYIITRVKYKIRNNSEQFLKVKLPEKASKVELWDSRADASPVSTGYDSEFRTHNLPIVRSQISAGESQPFFAEITYVYKDPEKTTALKKKRFELPKVHLPISELLWQVFTHEDFQFLKIDGNLDLNKLDRPEFIFASERSTQQNIVTQKSNKRESESAGLMPVRFEIPLSANKVDYKMLQIDPSGNPPFIEALIVGPQKKHKNLCMALALLIGFILTGSLSKIFTSKHKITWCLVTIIIVALTAGLMWLSVYGAKFILQGFITSIMLYLLYKFFAYTPERN